MTRTMNVEEVAVFLRVSQSTIYRLLKQNQIPAFKVGSDWRFDSDSIDRWRAARTIAVSAKRAVRARATIGAAAGSR